MSMPAADHGIGSLSKQSQAQPESVFRGSAPAARPDVWSGDGGRFRASLQVISGVAVLTLEGHLNREAIAVCRSALETALRLRTAQVVLDLQQTRVDEESRPVLALMERMSRRHGVTLWLARLTVAARGVLRTDRTAAYRIFPTVEAARTAAASLSQPRRR